MKLRIYLSTMIVFLFAATASAIPQQRLFRDVKLPTQKVLEYQTWTSPGLASATYYSNAHSSSGSVTTTVTSFSNSGAADNARNVTITPGGTSASIKGGTIVVSGLNIRGGAVSENFTVTNSTASIITGSKAFASLTSVVIPVQWGSGATYSIGTGSKLGLKHCTVNAGALLHSVFGGVKETTPGTLVSDPAVLELNTYALHGTMDGATLGEVYYVQNYGCN